MSGTSSRRASRARSRWRCTGSMPSTRKPKCVASRNGVGALAAADVDDPAVGAQVELAHDLEQHRRVARRQALVEARGEGLLDARVGVVEERRDPRPRERVCPPSAVGSPRMARRAFLHVGTAKSGTSYLQDLWWRHRDELRERGLLLPGDARRDHFAAAAVVKGMTVVVDDARRPRARRLAPARRGDPATGPATC